MEEVSAQLTALLNVVIAALLAAVPGLDRELRNRPAGLRTHMIVAMSAALIASMGRIQFSDDSVARVLSGVITGIGFLGAGVIWQRKSDVHELTTAASIWMVALLGIVVAYELHVLAVGSTLVLAFVLSVMRFFERRILRSHQPQDEQPKTE